MVKRRSVLALFLFPLAFSGCDDSELDLPDRDRIPEPGLHEDDGPLERAGERLDRFTDGAGEKLRHGVEETGDAAERAGDWLEQKTDEEGVADDHDPPTGGD